jgi:hypothetical protein
MRLKYVSFLLFVPLLLLGEFDLPQSLTQGSVEGQIKLFYYDIDKKTDEDSYATALGGYLKYSTDVNRTFYATVRFHTSQPVGSSLNREKTALFNSDRDGEQLTVNSEAYIGWRGSNRVLKVGNLMLNTPMMNDDTTRIVPWSYQGAAYTGEALPHTKVQLYHIGQIRSHTTDKYSKESASGQIGSGITMLSIEYDGFEHFDLQGYYYYAPDLYSTFIAQADYKYVIDKNNMLCLNVQYFNSGNAGEFAETENKNGGDDIDLLALRVSYTAEEWIVSLNYSQNFGISGIVRGYGGLAKVFTTSMIANGRGNYKPETWMLKSEYTLPLTSWGESELALNLTHTRTNDSRGDDFDAVYLHFKQRFNIDTSLFIRYENMDYKGDKSDVNYFRVIAAYDF